MLDLAKFVDKGVQVKLTGGRQGIKKLFNMILALSFDACLFHHVCVFRYCFAVTGTLKGYDQLLNLVLDEAVESVRGISFFTLSLCV